MALDATVEEVCAWYLAGESAEKIAFRLGRSQSYVDARLKAGGIKKRPPGVRGKGTRPERKVPANLRDEALMLYRSGLSAKAISEKLPISKPTVLRAIAEAGLQKRCQKNDIGLAAERLYSSGLSAKSVAVGLGVSKKTVLRYLSERGVSMRTQKCQSTDQIIEAYLSGASADQIGETFGVSAGHVFMTLRKSGVKPRRETKKNIDLDVNAIVLDYSRGKTPDQIGREYGVSRGTILGRLSAAGVKIRMWVEKYDYVSPCAGAVRVNGTWELAYAKILDAMFTAGLILRWQYEPDVIRLGSGMRYIPDFKVFNKAGGYVYHEIKGKLWPRSAAKILEARDAGCIVVLIRRRILGPMCRHYGVPITL